MEEKKKRKIMWHGWLPHVKNFFYLKKTKINHDELSTCHVKVN